jgi:endonuclease-3
MKLPLERIPEMERHYGKYWWPEDGELNYQKISKNPFTNIVFTVLSQNTSSNNTRRAYLSLARSFSVDPFTLIRADPKKLSDALRPGGLQNVKARRLIALSKFVVKEFRGDLGGILGMPKERLRERLKDLPGVGDKTADVLLTSLFGHREYLVVDTHMFRIAERLGLVRENAPYQEVQGALKEFLPLESMPEEGQERAVGLLWLLAKHTCSALRPKCTECVLNNICKKRI